MCVCDVDCQSILANPRGFLLVKKGVWLHFSHCRRACFSMFVTLSFCFVPFPTPFLLAFYFLLLYHFLQILPPSLTPESPNSFTSFCPPMNFFQISHPFFYPFYPRIILCMLTSKSWLDLSQSPFFKPITSGSSVYIIFQTHLIFFQTFVLLLY